MRAYRLRGALPPTTATTSPNTRFCTHKQVRMHATFTPYHGAATPIQRSHTHGLIGARASFTSHHGTVAPSQWPVPYTSQPLNHCRNKSKASPRPSANGGASHSGLLDNITAVARATKRRQHHTASDQPAQLDMNSARCDTAAISRGRVAQQHRTCVSA